MEKFEIAKLIVQMDAKGELLFDRSRAYLSKTDKEADITLSIPEAFFEAKHEAFPQLTLDECRYVWVGEAFYANLLLHDGLLMHASCVEKDGNAYLFSAKSGTGKSTHTHLWMDVFGDCRMINDDKPAIRKMDGTYYACGTPFSGKNDESENRQVPIRAIVFLERGAENHIVPLEKAAAIPLFLSQTLRPPKKELMVTMLDRLSDLLNTVPVFRLTCNMDPEAARVAYEGIEAYCRAAKEQGGQTHEN